MSVIVIARIQVDPAAFRRVEQARADDFRRISGVGKAAGALHHRFAFGDGEVVIIDEWTSAEAFQKFFDNPDIASLMQDAGASGPPEVSFYEAIDTVDQF